MLVNTPFVKCSMLFLSPTTEHWSIVKSPLLLILLSGFGQEPPPDHISGASSKGEVRNINLVASYTPLMCNKHGALPHLNVAGTGS